MAMLGEDLVLLTVQQGGGRLPAPNVTGVGLIGAELVRLAASGRVDIVSGRIGVLDAAPTGDAEASASRVVSGGDVTAAPAGHAAHHAVHAASHAAVSAAVHSATHAAVSAAHSAHSAGGGHGGGGGGGGGGHH